MARDYAIIESATETVLTATPGFAPEAVSERLPLPDGRTLLLCRGDEARAVAELKEQLALAQEENRAKESFLSTMSHDIRTPLNAIIGMTALAKKHIDEKPRVLDALSKIDVAGAHLLSLINDILDMSHINAGKMRIAEELFSLGDLLHDTLAIVQPQAAQKQHTFAFRTDNIYVESLYGDALRLRQIYVNIINNAVKYTNIGGQIDVTVSEAPSGDRCELIFVCKDNGIGISEAFLKRIFEPFERVSSSTISKIEGTGLGMSIVKKLIDAMGGTIGIESTLGQGTTVTIRIPLRYETVAISTDALGGKRILILEADESMHGIFDGYLSEYRIEHTIVRSSGEAIAAVTDADYSGHPYHAVVIGRKLDKAGNLFDFATYLHRSFPQVVIVLASDLSWNEIEYRANRCGISHFIPLPVFRKSLLNGLNRALSASEESAMAGFGSPNLTGKHILLVEDNLINREIALELLGTTNASVDAVEDGSQAVEAFRKSPEGYYRLILMDIQMPVMDGCAATEAIRAMSRSDAKAVKIIAMTANTFAEDISRARSAGMDGHLAKPINIPTLMQLLRSVL